MSTEIAVLADEILNKLPRNPNTLSLKADEHSIEIGAPEQIELYNAGKHGRGGKDGELYHVKDKGEKKFKHTIVTFQDKDDNVVLSIQEAEVVPDDKQKSVIFVRLVAIVTRHLDESPVKRIFVWNPQEKSEKLIIINDKSTLDEKVGSGKPNLKIRSGGIWVSEFPGRDYQHSSAIIDPNMYQDAPNSPEDVVARLNEVFGNGKESFVLADEKFRENILEYCGKAMQKIVEGFNPYQ